MQSMADGEYRYILTYQDHGMKDVYPVALKSKRVVEIAIALINIFKFLGLSARLATEEDLWDALPELFRELLNEANDLIDSRKGETLCDDPRDSESTGTHCQYKLSLPLTHFGTDSDCFRFGTESEYCCVCRWYRPHSGS